MRRKLSYRTWGQPLSGSQHSKCFSDPVLRFWSAAECLHCPARAAAVWVLSQGPALPQCPRYHSATYREGSWVYSTVMAYVWTQQSKSAEHPQRPAEVAAWPCGSRWTSPLCVRGQNPLSRAVVHRTSLERRGQTCRLLMPVHSYSCYVNMYRKPFGPFDKCELQLFSVFYLKLHTRTVYKAEMQGFILASVGHVLDWFISQEAQQKWLRDWVINFKNIIAWPSFLMVIA